MRLAGWSRLARSSAARNTVHRMTARGVELVRAAIVIPVIARYLGPAGYGAWAAALAAVLALRPVVVVGLEETLLVRAAQTPERLGALLAAIRRMSLFVALVALPVVAGIGFVGDGGRGMVLAALLGTTLLLEAATIDKTLLSLHHADRALVPAQVAAATLFVLGAGAVVLLDLGIFGLALALIAQAAVANVLPHLVVRRRLAAHRGPPAAARPLAREAWPRMLSGMALEAQLSLDVVVVAIGCGAAASGAYAAGWRVAALALILPYAISRTLLASYAGASTAEALRLCRRTSAGLAVAGALVAGALVLGSGLVVALFGGEFAALRPLMPYFAIRVAFLFASAPVSDMLLARGGHLDVLYARGLGAVVGLGLPWLLMPRWGVAGAAAALVVAELARAMALVVCWNRRYVRGRPGSAIP